jgi:RNA polymerase sigma-70 factor (ECF subfamily)
VRGKEVAIAEAEKLHLTGNPFYFTLLGELYQNIDDEKAKENLEQAYLLAKTENDKKTILKKMKTMESLPK